MCGGGGGVSLGNRRFLVSENNDQRKRKTPLRLEKRVSCTEKA